MSDLLIGMTITDTGNPTRLSGDLSKEKYRPGESKMNIQRVEQKKLPTRKILFTKVILQI